MNATDYKTLREAVGSQEKVAATLGLNTTTIQRREAGKRKISHEAEIAMHYLASFV